MEEYRARVRPTPPPSRKPTTTGFNLGDLASQYKLEDMMVTPDEPPVGDTVEKEYKAYIKSLSPKETDILKFWEVNIRHPLDILTELINNKHILAQRNRIPHPLCHRSRLPPNPGLCRSL